VHETIRNAVTSGLGAAEASSPVEAVEAVTSELGRALGALGVSFLVADLSGRSLVRLTHVQLSATKGGAAFPPAVTPGERRDGEESAIIVPFDGGAAEQAVRSQQIQVSGPGARDSAARRSSTWRVLAPVTERGEVIGLLEMHLPEEPSEASLGEIGRLAHLLAFVVIANRRHTDLFQWGQRSRPLSLSAEIQQRLLPGPRTCEAGSFTLSAWLEPAASIAGDTFDFNVARDHLHLSLTDAMGHGVAAALAATLCVGSLRNARTAGATLLEQATLTNLALLEHAAASGLEDFVTGLLGRVDLRTGVLELVNAGHVAPYLARGRDVASIELAPDLPLGLFRDATYHSTRLVLEAGDRVILLTDGMLERRAANVDLPAAIRGTRSLHPREVVQALADRVLAATGQALSDDATVLCLDWHGGHGRDRESVHGAEQVRASQPRG
jgi:serine phosphatase RsbU (regulator of sigma subunit)